MPQRGAGPIALGVFNALGLMGHQEINAIYLPASTTIEYRGKTVENIVHRVLSKNASKYKRIVILDEAVSGSSTNMIRNAVIRAVKRLKKDKEWQRFYWKFLPVHILVLTAYSGRKIEKGIRFFYLPEEIPTMDRAELSPVRYPDIRKTVISSAGIKTHVFGPHIMYDPRKGNAWKDVKAALERGYAKG